MNDNDTTENNEIDNLRKAVEHLANFVRSNPFSIEAPWITMVMMAMRMGLKVNFPQHKSPTEYPLSNYLGDEQGMAFSCLLACRDEEWPHDVIEMDELIELSKKYDITLRVGNDY